MIQYYSGVIVNNFTKNPIKPCTGDVVPVFAARFLGAALTSASISLIIKAFSQMFQWAGQTGLANRAVLPAFAKNPWTLVAFNIGLPALSILLQLVFCCPCKIKQEKTKEITQQETKETTQQETKETTQQKIIESIPDEIVLDQDSMDAVDEIENALVRGDDCIDVPTSLVNKPNEIHRILTAVQIRYPFPEWEFSYDGSMPKLETFTWKSKSEQKRLSAIGLKDSPLNKGEFEVAYRLQAKWSIRENEEIPTSINNGSIKRILNYFTKYSDCKDLIFDHENRMLIRSGISNALEAEGTKILFQELNASEKQMYLEVATTVRGQLVPVKPPIESEASISKIITALNAAYLYTEFSYDPENKGFISSKAQQTDG